MTKQIDLGSHNPRMQCRVCGKWMRLSGRDNEGHYYQRFFPCYGTQDDQIIEHEGDVCITCESQMPNWKPFEHPMLPAIH
jgi:hypothetical protein